MQKVDNTDPGRHTFDFTEYVTSKRAALVYLPQAVQEYAVANVRVVSMSVLAIITSCILCRQLLFTIWDECEKDISCTQTFLLATCTALSLHEGVVEDCSLSGFKCWALIKRAISYTIFKPPHEKKLQRHMLFAAK